MAMKAKHILGTALLLVGALYVWHMYNQHGTFKSAMSGLGINR